MKKQHPAFNAYVRKETDGTYTICNVKGVEMVQCPHCRSVRPVDSFKDNDELATWFRCCVQRVPKGI